MGWGNNTAPTETLTGAGTLNLVAAGTVSRDDISANMTAFTGTINFSGSGSVRLFINGGQVGAGFTSSTVDLAGSANLNPQTNSGGNTINVNALTGTSATATLGGGSAGSPNYSVGASGTDTTFAGGIRGNAALTKVGSGVLTLTNGTLLDYTGATNVNLGSLKMMGIKSGVGATAVNTGGTLAGSGSIAGTTSVNNGGTLAPGDAGTGNLTFANLTLNNGGTLKLGTTPTTNKAVVQTAGTLTLASGIIVDVNGYGTDGTYDIIDITGATLSGTAATAFTATNTSGGKVYTFSSTATAIRMTIAGSDPSNYWNVDGVGSWATAVNWTKNPAIPNASEGIAKIGPGVGGLGGAFTGTDITITLDGDRTVGLLAFDDNSGTVVTIDPGTPTGSLLMDNGASSSNMVVVTGQHIINAPVVMNALGMGVDAGNPHSLTINGVVSGIGASLSKTGTGKLFLTGDNTYDGGTILSGGVLNINSATSLGNASGVLRFTGGTLQIANALSGITRDYQVSGANNALIDTNGFSFGYDGVISPYSGGTGGLVKSGAGTLTLAGANTYTGNTTVSAGVLEVAPGGSIDGAALTFGTTAGTLFHVNGGTFEGTTSTVSAGITGFRLSSGSATFTGALSAQSISTGVYALINVQGGSLSAASVSVGRSSGAVTAEPAAGATNSGFVVNGTGTVVDIAGNLLVAGPDSTANARMDGGTVTVGGTATIGLNNADRWSVLDVNGAAFTLNNTATGVQLGNGNAGNAIFIVQDGGVANVGKFTFNAAGTAACTEMVKVNGGTLYVGAGGMVRTGTNASCVSTLKLQGGTLGASADWTSPIDTTLTGTPIIKAADATAAPFNITLSGVLSGTGALTKTGGGILTLSAANTYAGNTTVAEGTLALPDDSRLLFVLGAASGNTNQLAGAGTITLDGDFAINTAAAVALTSGTWVLENATTLPGAYGGTFQVVDPDGTPWTDAGIEKWTKTDGAKTWSFDETTGTLTLSQSGFSSWATTHAGGGAASADFDGDGVSNAAEWVLGGLETTNDLGKLPGVSTTGGNLIFTFVRDQQSISADTTVSIETSTDLAGWPNSYGVPDIATPVGTVTVAKDTAPGKDTVTLTVPQAPDVKKFAHLKVVITP
jgi:autotransporter-associated beta strand protein